MMRDSILMINPAINPSSQSKIINAVINTTFPTSLGALAGYLMAKGIASVRMIDEQLHFISDSQLAELVHSLEKPRIIGLSVLTINSKRAYVLAEKIKKIDSETLVVAGGIHPTVVPEEALRLTGIDIVVRGEGEETFYELVHLIFNEKDYSSIKGISLRKNGSIIHNQDRAMIMNLDDLPPFPYHLFEQDREKYPSFGGLLTSRGCPYNCIFCSSRSISGRRYRYFSIERVISEIKLLVYRYNQKTIWMMDDNIAGNRMRFLELLDAIMKAELPKDVHFHGSMRGDNINDEVLDKAKAANFKMIAFGLETGCESLMRLIDKGESVKQVVEAIKKTEQKGIAAATTIIFGLPGETRKDRWDTIRMVNTLPLSSVRFNILTPYPGTSVYKMLNRRGEILFKKDWENFAVQYMWEGDGLPYVPKGNNVYELIFDTMLANLSFYLSFKGIKRMLRSSFAGGNVINLSKKWYFSPKTIWKFAKVVAYLSYRFVSITLKMLINKIKINKCDKYKSIKESLESFVNSDIDKEPAFVSKEKKRLDDSYLKKIFENVLYEKYVDLRRPLYTYIPFNYQRIPGMIRYHSQKLFKKTKPDKSVFPAWPFEESLEKLRKIALDKYTINDSDLLRRLRWPENKQYALILTHDIEGANNWKWVRTIAEIEKEYGFRSSWNVVPKLYQIDYATLGWLIENGFEIGLHGYNHDNKLSFLSEDRIRRRIESSYPLIKQYNIRGFRSPSWLRSETLFKVLQDYFIYDCSVLDVDYISPGGIGGCCSIFPYNIGKLVELPTTLPYELPIQFGVTQSNLNSFWSQKIQWIKKNKGAIVVNTHPDPYYGGNQPMVNMYKSFLEKFKEDKDVICMLPSNAAEHYAKFNANSTR